MPQVSARDFKLHYGRGQLPRPLLVPIVKANNDLQLWKDPVASYWVALSAKLALLRKLFRKLPDNNQTLEVYRDVKKMTRDIPSWQDKATDTEEQNHLEQHLKEELSYLDFGC